MSDTSLQLQPLPALAPRPAPAEDVPFGPRPEPAPLAAPPIADAPRHVAAPELPAFGLPHVSSAEIRAELRRREARIAKLLGQRSAIMAELDRIEATLAALRDER